MFRTCVALILAAALLGGCDLGVRANAAKGVERFLAAAQAGDRAAFEAAIDRPALRADLRRQLMDLGRAEGLEVEGGPSDQALDRMITPEAFRVVQAESGEALASAPSAARLEGMMKVSDRRHACLSDAGSEGRCLLTFAKRDNTWRLVGMPATDLKIRMAP